MSLLIQTIYSFARSTLTQKQANTKALLLTAALSFLLLLPFMSNLTLRTLNQNNLNSSEAQQTERSQHLRHTRDAGWP